MRFKFEPNAQKGFQPASKRRTRRTQTGHSNNNNNKNPTVKRKSKKISLINKSNKFIYSVWLLLPFSVVSSHLLSCASGFFGEGRFGCPTIYLLHLHCHCHCRDRSFPSAVLDLVSVCPFVAVQMERGEVKETTPTSTLSATIKWSKRWTFG